MAGIFPGKAWSTLSLGERGAVDFPPAVSGSTWKSVDDSVVANGGDGCRLGPGGARATAGGVGDNTSVVFPLFGSATGTIGALAVSSGGTVRGATGSRVGDPSRGFETGRSSNGWGVIGPLTGVEGAVRLGITRIGSGTVGSCEEASPSTAGIPICRGLERASDEAMVR